MKVIDEKTLDRFRTPGPCEWCGRDNIGCEPHHVFAKGIGGGNRIDLPINLVALCRECHTHHHNGKMPTREQLLCRIIERERHAMIDLIEREIYRIRREGITRD